LFALFDKLFLRFRSECYKALMKNVYSDRLTGWF